MSNSHKKSTSETDCYDLLVLKVCNELIQDYKLSLIAIFN